MIPDYQSLMRPVLVAAANGPRKISDVVEEVSDKLGLTPEERSEMLPSGKQTTIANRVHWARTYLKQAGLVRNPRRGWYEPTDLGRQVLSDQSVDLNTKYLERFEQFQEFKSRSRDNGEVETAGVIDTTESATPDETILAAYKRLNAALAANLLDSVRGASPAFFEQLIVDLFLAMGYGGSFEEAGRALGQSGDDGIDGVIDQDPLGVDQVYLQAKRYAQGNNIGSGDIRDFFGALSLKKANKGIFVTTSAFSSAAIETAQGLGSRIVLIDGPELADLMIRYNIGCRDKSVLHLKEIDEAFFDEDV